MTAMIKRKLILPLLLLCVLMVMGCSRPDIVGKWRSGDIDNGSYWVFYPDGKLTITSGIIVTQATYKLNGRKLTTVQDRPIVYDVSCDQDELTLRSGSDVDILRRVKE